MTYGLHKIERKITVGPEITFDCPHCGNPSVAASTEGIVERWLSFHLIPLFCVRYTNLTCCFCGTRFRLDHRLEIVAAMRPEELSRRIRTRVPTFAKWLVGIGLGISLLVAFAAAESGVFGSEMLASTAFAGVSFIGFVLCGIGLATAARKASAWKFAAAFGLAPFAISLAFMLGNRVTGKSNRPSDSFPSHPQPAGVDSSRPDIPGPLGFTPPSRPERAGPSTGQSGATAFSVGDKVEGNWSGRWRPAVVTELHGHLLVLRFEDSEKPPRITLPASMVRPLAAATRPPQGH